MSQHTKQSKENGGRIPFQPFSIASRSRFKNDKYAPQLPKPTLTHVCNLVDEKGKPKYIRFANGQIMRRNGSQN